MDRNMFTYVYIYIDLGDVFQDEIPCFECHFWTAKEV